MKRRQTLANMYIGYVYIYAYILNISSSIIFVVNQDKEIVEKSKTITRLELIYLIPKYICPHCFVLKQQIGSYVFS